MSAITKLQEHKERIISLMKTSGPQLPGRIASHIGVTPLFTSAFLAEMVSEKRLKVSDMKVGASPVYYIEGQEAQLENFIEHLNQKEREAFHALKKSSILADEEQQPAIRVALRKIKDFAVPITVRDTETDKSRLFWKFFILPDEQMKSLVSQIMLGKPKKEKKEEIKRVEENPEMPKDETKPETKELISQVKQEIKEIEQEVKKPRKIKEKKEKKADTKFRDKVADYLISKDIEILQEILIKKKEFISKVRLDTIVGKQEFYLISKEKSIVTTDDLVSAMQKAQSEKMPALVLATGKLHKNAQDYLKEWRNLIKFESVKL